MRHNIILIIISLVVTLSTWVVPIYLKDIGLFFVPIMTLLFFIGLAGLGTLPVEIFYLIKKYAFNKWLTTLNRIALGYYAGYLIFIPIHNWDEKQRNLGGQIVAELLEEYKISHNKYPDNLSQLDTKKLNALLPFTYQVNRFNYSSLGNKFELEIPTNIMDRWYWNDNKKIFEYDDL